MKLQKLSRQTVWVDKRGRFTIPDYLRDAAGIKPETWLEVVADPGLDNCKGLLLRAQKT